MRKNVLIIAVMSLAFSFINDVNAEEETSEININIGYETTETENISDILNNIGEEENSEIISNNENSDAGNDNSDENIIEELISEEIFDIEDEENIVDNNTKGTDITNNTVDTDNTDSVENIGAANNSDSTEEYADVNKESAENTYTENNSDKENIKIDITNEETVKKTEIGAPMDENNSDNSQNDDEVQASEGLIFVFINYPDNIEENTKIEIEKGKCISSDMLEFPQAKRGCIFEGWYVGKETDGNIEYLYEYDFSKPVEESISLYPKWMIADYDISWYSDEKEEYIIESAAQLRGLSFLVNGLSNEYDEPISFEGRKIKLNNYISLKDELWMPIGTNETPFKGEFLGEYNAISRFKTNNYYEYNGLFGVVLGTVKELYISNAVINGSKYGYCATAAGYVAPDGVIENVTVSGSVSGGKYAGGIAGYSDGGLISDTNNANIRADEYAGGIAGFAEKNSVIAGCINSSLMNSVNVTAKEYAGGIAGYGCGKVNKCTNNGEIVSETAAGGIIGKIKNSFITLSFNNGNVKSDGGAAGGIIGEGNSVIVQDCANTVNPSADVFGGIAANADNCTIKSCYTFYQDGINGDILIASGSNNTIKACYYLQNEDSKEPNKEENLEDAAENKPEEKPSGEAEDKPEEENSDDENTNSQKEVHGLLEEQFKSGELSWLLNTEGADVENRKIWGFDKNGPVIADEKNTPIFKINAFFDENKGSLISVPIYAVKNKKVSVKAAAELGYSIDGIWREGAVSGKEDDIVSYPYYFYMPEEDVNLYISFSKNNQDDKEEEKTKCTVTFNAGNGVFYAGTDKECKELDYEIIKGKRVSAPPNPSLENSIFEGWFYDKNGNEEYDFNNKVTENITLFAIYHSQEKYTVTFDNNGGQGTAPESQTVLAGEHIKRPAEPEWQDETKSFGGWSAKKNDSSKVWDFNKDVMPEEDLVLYALWIENDLDFQGDGIASSPYLIKSDEDFVKLADKVANGNSYDGRYFSLENPGLKITHSIGNRLNPFAGIFDGNGKSVTLNIDSDDDYQGLFGYIDGGSVSNLRILGEVHGGSYVGGAAGYAEDGIISDCINEADITARNSYAGGIVGTGKAENCENRGSINGIQYVGGILGKALGNIASCMNYGEVNGQNGYTAGIAGDASEMQIDSCQNIGDISLYDSGNGRDEKAYTGGIAGIAAIVKNCVNSGAVNGFARSGGIAGRITGSALKCENGGSVYGSVRAGGISGSLAANALISYCKSDSAVKASASYAGGISGESEIGSVIEYCISLAKDISAAEAYSGGISARGGSIRNSFYYNSEHMDFALGNGADIQASYTLSSGSGADDDFTLPEKSKEAFMSGMVSWLMNTDGKGLFDIEGHTKGNSEIWSVDGFVPVYANNNAIFAVMLENENSEYGGADISGGTRFFGQKGVLYNISYRTSENGMLQSIEVFDLWSDNSEMRLEADEDGVINIPEMRLDKDTLIVSSFAETAEEEEEDPNEPDEEEKPNEEEKPEEPKEPEKLNEEEKPKKHHSYGGKKDNGKGIGDSGDGSGNGNGDGSGVGEGDGGGGSSGSKAAGVSGSYGGSPNAGNGSFGRVDSENSDTFQTQSIRTSKSDKESEFAETVIPNNGANIISEENNGSSEEKILMSISDNTGGENSLEDIKTSDEEINDNHSYEELYGDDEKPELGSAESGSSERLAKVVQIKNAEELQKNIEDINAAGALSMLIGAFISGFAFSIRKLKSFFIK